MARIRYVQFLAIITLLTGALLAQGTSFAQADPHRISIQPLRVYGVGTVIPGTGSILVRTKEGVGATVHTFGLVPGNAYTFWLSVFNNPKKCATDPCTAADLPNPAVQAVVLWASGQIAGDEGLRTSRRFLPWGIRGGRQAWGRARPW